MKALKYSLIGVFIVLGGLVAAFFIDLRVKGQTKPGLAKARLYYAQGMAAGEPMGLLNHWTFYPPKSN